MKIQYFSIIVVLLLLFSACSNGSSSNSSNSDDDSLNETITLNGTLLAGTILAANTRAVANAAAAQAYTVVAIDNQSNKTYPGTTDVNGSFSIEIPAQGTFLLSYIHNGSYIGPTVFDSSDNEIFPAIKPSSDTDLGNITLDEANGYAITQTSPQAVNSSITAMAQNGIPVGAGNDGKTPQDQITSNREDSDEDMDGIPNLFDADEDNDGIRNGIESLPSASQVESDYIKSVYMSSNIWAPHDTVDTAEALIALRLHVVPQDGLEDQISSVECIDVPSSIADVATVRWADSLGDPVDYPQENSLWSDSDYGLYETTTLDTAQWIISITPNAIMEVGDTFTLRVSSSDGGSEIFFIVLSYFIQDWAKIASYNSIDMPEDQGINTDPVEFASDTLELVISKATDEDGNVLEGLNYSIRYGQVDCTGGTCPVPANPTEDILTGTTAGSTVTATIDTSVSGTYYITPVAETQDGQRNGEETWFTRQ